MPNHAEHQFTLPDKLKVRSISQHGEVKESVVVFGGRDELRKRASSLQYFLYAP